MTTTRRGFAAGALGLAAAPVFAPAPGLAQPAWPTRPVSITVAFAAGGPVDVLARMLGQRLAEQMPGAAFVVDNRVGGGGTVSARHVIQSPPDGHTLLMLTSAHAVNETLAKPRPYDLARDLRPILQFAATPYWLVARPGLAASLAELVEKLKTTPMTFASGGPGGLTHLLGEMLKEVTRSDLTHVPYRGNAPAISDLVAGRVDFMFDNGGIALEQVRAGRLVALASTSAAPLPATPGVPGMVQLGYRGFDVSAWIGLAAPAGTPDIVVTRLSAEVRSALADAGFRARIAAAGAEPAFRDDASFASLIAEEIPRWAAVIERAGITAQ
jgi:tripartite-type tricarboxylate transporter receptor subunit TctC